MRWIAKRGYGWCGMIKECGRCQCCLTCAVPVNAEAELVLLLFFSFLFFSSDEAFIFYVTHYNNRHA